MTQAFQILAPAAETPHQPAIMQQDHARQSSLMEALGKEIRILDAGLFAPKQDPKRPIQPEYGNKRVSQKPFRAHSRMHYPESHTNVFISNPR